MIGKKIILKLQPCEMNSKSVRVLIRLMLQID
jgi:hypothetical protein